MDAVGVFPFRAHSGTLYQIIFYCEDTNFLLISSLVSSFNDFSWTMNESMIARKHIYCSRINPRYSTLYKYSGPSHRHLEGSYYINVSHS